MIEHADVKSKFNLLQGVLLSHSFAVLCFQLAVVNGHNTHLTPSGKDTRPTGLNNKGTDGTQPLGTTNLYSGPAYKRANEAPTKAINVSSSKPVMPSKGQLSIGKAVVKKRDSTTNATKSSQGRWPGSGVRNVRGHRKRRTNFASSRRRITNTHKGWLATRRGRKRKRGVKNVFIVSNNGTAKNDSKFQGDNVTARNQTNHHPCNSIQAPSMEYKVGKIECRRWQSTELQQEMNCRGMYNHQYLASSFKEALKFKDLDTGRDLYLSKTSFILNHKPPRRQKRNVRINPGETLIVQCHGGKTPTPSGHLRICPICMAITRQPSNPRRFPEDINELLCDPQMVSSYLPGIDAFCVQKTFTLDLLQFSGDWEMNAALSAEAGHDVYTEKWELYTQTIRRHCACELLPSSPMVSLL